MELAELKDYLDTVVYEQIMHKLCFDSRNHCNANIYNYTFTFLSLKYIAVPSGAAF